MSEIAILGTFLLVAFALSRLFFYLQALQELQEALDNEQSERQE